MKLLQIWILFAAHLGLMTCQKTGYFSQESHEIDSSEHGGPPGPRSTTCKCGWANKNSKRIVGGRETGINEYPFIVALVDHTRRQFCGGTILTTHHVLTAAHCTIKFRKRWMSVIVGDHDLTTYDETRVTQVIPVKKIFIHENYDDVTVKNDISVLLLEQGIQFSQFVGPACISPVRPNLDNKNVKTIGWGKLKHNGTASNLLMEVNLRVVPLDICAERYSIMDPAENTQVCAYGNQKGSCQGDSGGPLLWVDPETNRYTVVGIVSYGRICGSTDPTVFTNPSAFYDWIENQIKESSPGNNIHQICTKV